VILSFEADAGWIGALVALTAVIQDEDGACWWSGYCRSRALHDIGPSVAAHRQPRRGVPRLVTGSRQQKAALDQG
jgi:hypothetical protein